MNEKIVSVERVEDLIAVFGSFDENIRRIEDALSVNIVNRGNELKIVGEPEAVDKAVRTLEGLMQLAARGEIIMFVDSDDLLALDICARVAKEMRDYDLMIMNHQAFCSTEQIKDRLSGPAAHAQDLCSYSREDWVCSQLGSRRIIPKTLNLNTVWAKAYKRQFVEDYGIVFPEKILMGEDMLFNLLVLLKEPKVCTLPVKACFYRYNQTSIVHRYIADYHLRDSMFQKTLADILHREEIADHFVEALGYQKLVGLLQTFSSDIFHRNNPKPEAEKKADFLTLVSREEYRNLVPGQLKYFSPEKQLALWFARHQLYYPIKMMYLIKDRIRKLN